jgi:hypothetical protein
MNSLRTGWHLRERLVYGDIAMLLRSVGGLFLVLILAGPASAGSKQLATPVILPHTDGSFRCYVTNVSTKKAATVVVTIHNANAGVVEGPATFQLAPGEADGVSTGHDFAWYCVATVTKGSLKDIRVSAIVTDPSDVILGVVEGH